MAHFKPMQKTTAFRKLAAAMWRAPNDPTITGHIDVDFTNALQFMSRYNGIHRCKVTPTHMVGRAVGILLNRYPEANAKIGFSNILLRKSADVNFLVATENGRDLWGIKLEAADTLPLSQIESELRSAAAQVRERTDPAMQRGRSLIRFLPIWLLRPVVAMSAFATIRLGIDMSFLGFPRDGFGGAIITSVGMYGLKTGTAALSPPSPCSLVFAVMMVTNRPWVVDDKVVPRPILRINCTCDHRTIDGYLSSKILGDLEHLLTHPEEMLVDGK